MPATQRKRGPPGAAPPQRTADHLALNELDETTGAEPANGALAAGAAAGIAAAATGDGVATRDAATGGCLVAASGDAGCDAGPSLLRVPSAVPRVLAATARAGAGAGRVFFLAWVAARGFGSGGRATGGLSEASPILRASELKKFVPEPAVAT